MEEKNRVFFWPVREVPDFVMDFVNEFVTEYWPDESLVNMMVQWRDIIVQRPKGCYFFAVMEEHHILAGAFVFTGKFSVNEEDLSIPTIKYYKRVIFGDRDTPLARRISLSMLNFINALERNKIHAEGDDELEKELIETYNFRKDTTLNLMVSP